MSVRYIGRENARKRLAPLEGAAGRTVTRAARPNWRQTPMHLRVHPTFGLAHEGTYETSMLRRCSTRSPPTTSSPCFLVRLGGYAIGVFDGEQLVASKVGSRFVKNRHKKGGSSVEPLPPPPRRAGEGAGRGGGGGRRGRPRPRGASEPSSPRSAATAAPSRPALATRPDLAWLRERAIPRFLDVPEPRHRTLEALPYDLYAVPVRRGVRHR